MIGALGIVTKDLENYLKEIPGNIETNAVQKIAILGTAHILWKALMMQ